jgi:hypothetical protein
MIVVFRFNSFAAPQVRVQVEQQQRAITDGPYRIVRHPMYAGALLMFVGTPLLLGSGGACCSFRSAALASVFGRWARNACYAGSWRVTRSTPAASGSGWFPASGETSLSRQEQSAPHPLRTFIPI